MIFKKKKKEVVEEPKPQVVYPKPHKFGFFDIPEDVKVVKGFEAVTTWNVFDRLKYYE